MTCCHLCTIDTILEGKLINKYPCTQSLVPKVPNS